MVVTFTSGSVRPMASTDLNVCPLAFMAYGCAIGEPIHHVMPF